MYYIFTIQLQEQDKKALALLAEREGIKQIQVIRKLIRQEAGIGESGRLREKKTQTERKNPNG